MIKLSEKVTQELDEAQARFVKESKKILFNEAVKNLPYKVGDIVKDHYQIGEIESIVISTSSSDRVYSIAYKCKRLTKKLLPYRGGEKTVIYGNNIIV